MLRDLPGFFHNLQVSGRFPYLRPGLTFERAWPKIDPVSGWLVSPHQERWLFEAVRRLPRNATILEIGSFQGRSTVSLALACLGTSRRVFAVDTFQGNSGDFVRGKNSVDWAEDDFFGQFSANVLTCGVADYVMPLAGLSQEVARHWRAPIHMLFVDGSHAYDDVVADWAGFGPYVVSGGLVAFHDVTPEWEGPYRAWNHDIQGKLHGTGFVNTLAYGTKP